jgi:RNA recognition motif-containing protein
MSDSEDSDSHTTKQSNYAPAPTENATITGTGTDDDPYTYTDTFGIVYQWDKEKSVWASKEDLDSLVAKQQEAYNAATSTNNTSATSAEEKKKRKKENKKKNKNKNKKKKNSGVYISGLPPDITVPEVVAFMSKCGVPKKDSVDPSTLPILCIILR